MAAARRPSPHNSPWTVGTKSSTRTQSWTASFTMLTASNSPAKACDGPKANRTRRVDHTASPMPEIHRPERLATRAASFRNRWAASSRDPGRHCPVTPGRLRRNPQPPLSNPVHTSMPSCSRLSRSGHETSQQVAPPAYRPSVTATRHDGVGNMQAGTKRCSRPNQKITRKRRTECKPDTLIPVPSGRWWKLKRVT